MTRSWLSPLNKGRSPEDREKTMNSRDVTDAGMARTQKHVGGGEKGKGQGGPPCF